MSQSHPAIFYKDDVLYARVDFAQLLLTLNNNLIDIELVLQCTFQNVPQNL